MKLYVHYEIVDPAVTLCYEAKSDSTVNDLLQWFAHTYNQKYSNSLNCLSLELRNSCCERLQPYHCLLSELVSDRDDIFICSCPKRSPTKQLIYDKVQDNKSAPSTSSLSAAVDTSRIAPIPDIKLDDINAVYKEIDSLYRNQQFRRVREVCKQLLASTAVNDPYLLYTISRVHFANERYEQAVEFMESAMKASRTSTKPISAITMTNMRLHYCLAMQAAGQYDEAVVEIDKFIEFLGTYDEIMKSKDSTKTLLLHEAVAMRAECLFESGYVNEAANVVNRQLSHPTAEKSVRLLQAYAHFALKYDKFEDSVLAVLKLVGLSEKDKKTQKLVAQFLRYSNAIPLIEASVPLSAQTVSIYNYLVGIAKDNSMITTANAILEKLVTIGLQANCQWNALLTLVHNYELGFEFKQAMTAISNHLNRLPALTICQTPDRAISAKEFLDCIQADESQLNYGITFDKTKGKVLLYDRSSLMTVESVISSSLPIDSSSSSKRRAFTNEELSLVALMMTCVKIFYLTKKFSLIPLLVMKIEFMLSFSNVSVHETSIRNENAYYLMIVHLLSSTSMSMEAAQKFAEDEEERVVEIVDDVPTTSTATTPRDESKIWLSHFNNSTSSNSLLVIGDSHILSSAWSAIQINGKNYSLSPKLLTGLKHYHFHASMKNFYPVYGFNALKTLLMSASTKQVIMQVGEIDCREGILRSIEMDKYATVEEAMLSTCMCFINTLKDLLKRRKDSLVIFIHPIMPMLDITFPMVMAYNETYQKAVAKVPGLVWLDIIPRILAADGKSIREDLKFDGTHIHPKYMEYVEDSINSYYSTKK